MNFENYIPGLDENIDLLYKRFCSIAKGSNLICNVCKIKMKKKDKVYCCKDTETEFLFLACKPCYFKKGWNLIPKIYINYTGLFFLKKGTKDYIKAVGILKSQNNRCFYCETKAFSLKRGKLVKFVLEKNLDRVHCHMCLKPIPAGLLSLSLEIPGITAETRYRLLSEASREKSIAPRD